MGVVLTMLTTLLVAVPTPLDAQQTSEEEASITRSVRVEEHDATWRVRLEPTVEQHDSGRALAIYPPDSNRPPVDIALPKWASPPRYDLEARMEKLEAGHYALLATVAPTSSGGDAGTDVTIQAAWVAHHRGGDSWNWRLVQRVQRSRLDGGHELRLRPRDATHELVEIPRNGTTTICGPSSESRMLERIYDVESRRFERPLDLERYFKDAEKLDATLPEEPFEGPFTRGVYQWYWASSGGHGSSTTSTTVRPLELGDRRGGSAWTIDARSGLRGEYATAHVTEALPVESLHIVPGLAAGREAYRENGRPKRVLVRFSNGRSFVISLPDVPYHDLVDRRGLTVRLPEPIATSCMSVVYLDAYEAPSPPEDGTRPVAFAEMAPLTVVDRRTAEATAEAVVERVANEPDLTNRRRISHAASGLQDELVRAVESALEDTTGQKRRRIIPLLQNLPADRAVPVLMRFLRELDADAVEFRPVKRSLAVHRERAAAPLSKMLVEMRVDDPKYTDLVRLLGRVGRPPHLARLIDDFGKGSKFLRNERVRAVAAGGEAMLERLFSVVAVGRSNAKVRDALKAIYLIGKRNHREELGSHGGTDALRELFRRTEDRRTLMHAFRAARYYRVDGFVELLETAFLDASDPLVREAAVGALARYPTTGARASLERALEDSNPDVRIAAIDGLSRREDRQQSVGAILRYIRREGWSPGRQRALNVLAEIETPRTTAYFETLLRNRRHEKPRLATRAASTLSRSERGIDADLAREIALDAEASPRLRIEMIDLLGLDDSERGEAFLMTLIDGRRTNGLVDDTRLRSELERRALLSLGRRRSDRARPRLLEIAKTGTDLSRRRHAIRSLAFYREADLADELASWRSEAPPQLRPTIDQTVGIIENRGTIEDVQKQIDRSLEND